MLSPQGLNELHFSTSAKELPASANVVVIGGGIIGTSVAYHLGKFLLFVSSLNSAYFLMTF